MKKISRIFIVGSRAHHSVGDNPVMSSFTSLSLFSRLSANTLFTPRSLFLTSQCRFNGQELLLRRDRSRWCPRLRRRHEVADPSRPHHKHHLRCQIQNFWMRQCDREFELSDRIGEGNDLGRCGESEEYGDCEGIMLAACEMYVVFFSCHGG